MISTKKTIILLILAACLVSCQDSGFLPVVRNSTGDNSTSVADNSTITINATNVTNGTASNPSGDNSTTIPINSTINVNATNSTNGTGSNPSSDNSTIIPINSTSIGDNSTININNTNITNGTATNSSGDNSTVIPPSNSSNSSNFCVYSGNDSYYLPAPIDFVGSASIDLAPEIAILSISVQTSAANASSALTTNKNAINKTVTALIKLGLNQSDIATGGFSIYPTYEQLYNNTTMQYSQKLNGYQVTNTLTVTTTLLDQIGDIIDTAVANGVNLINSVTFDLTDATKRSQKKTLIKDAIADAQSQAEEAVDAINYKITGVKGISLAAVSPYPIPYAYEVDAAASSDSVSTPIYQSLITISQQVTMSYLIQAQ